MESTEPCHINAGRLSYRPQLDGLRAFAVLGVLMHHFLNLEALRLPLLHLPWGHLGVRLFFVLSGFLITRILLDYRDAAEAGDRWSYLRKFYFRRSIRIFPLYYAVVLTGCLFDIPPIREVFWWLMTYTINIHVSVNGAWLPQVGHFWTLAVEEQFYLIWPWLVLFAPRKWLVPSLIAIVAIGPAYRWIAVLNDFNPVATFAMAPACMDTLGAGALVATMVHRHGVQQTHAALVKFALPIGLIGMVAMHLLSFWNLQLNNVLLDCFVALFFAWLVFAANRGFAGVVGAILQCRPIVYVGRISYGIYVYHFFTPLLIWPVLNQFPLGVVEWQLWNFVLSTIVTLIVSIVSWHLFEKPINELKESAPKVGHSGRGSTKKHEVVLPS